LIVAGSLENEVPRFHQSVAVLSAGNPDAVSPYSTTVPFEEMRRLFSFSTSETPGSEYSLSQSNAGSAETARRFPSLVSRIATRGLLVGDGLKMRYVSSAPSVSTAECEAENPGQIPPSISSANECCPGARYKV
jgi:hypothetical protein